MIALAVIAAGLALWGLANLAAALKLRADALSPYVWSVIGDVLRNAGGLLALMGATAAVLVAWRTNRARAREAAGAEFRHHMQWCVEKLAQENADYIEKLFALSILDRYATMQDRRLPEQDREIAATINELAQLLHAPKDADDIQDNAQDNRS